MEYFLTGGTGFLGGHLAGQLLDDGHDLVVLARTPDDASDLADRGAEVVQGDITDKESMREPMAGVDGVFHLAAWYEVGATDPSPAYAINVEGTRNVLELVDELEVPKAVYTSTLAVNSDTSGREVDETYSYDGEHRSVYDRTKWQAHYEVAEPLAEAGVPIVTVMPGVVYGPGDTSPMAPLWEGFLTGGLPAIPRKSAYSWGHVEDIARAHVLAMDEGTPGEEYIVAGESATLVEVMDLAADITGIDPPRAVSPRWFGMGARLASLAGRVVALPPEYRAESLRALAGVTYLGDNSKAVQDLGLEHRPLREGLAEMLAFERDRLDR